MTLLAALAIGVIAVVDHRHKDNVLFRHGRIGWICMHGGGRCDEVDAVERRWSRRENVYRGSIAVLGVAALALAVAPHFRSSFDKLSRTRKR